MGPDLQELGARLEKRVATAREVQIEARSRFFNATTTADRAVASGTWANANGWLAGLETALSDLRTLMMKEPA